VSDNNTTSIPSHYKLTLSNNRYLTEKAVGKAIKKSGIPRQELFITTKLWNNKHHPDDVAPALQQSLDDLELDYVDLYLIHWPVAWKRGDDLFPKQDGNMILENIDIVDVRDTGFSWTSLGHALTSL
jgi:alcohol dehydrogenase (NADP+)